MTRGIIIFGSAGSGKTTLGKLVAKKLDYPYFDIDDYIWRKDTDIPFSVMYSRDEKISRLMADISKYEHFVMAGSMDSFNTPFVPLFDLAVHINADVKTRISRIQKREFAIYGERITQGGDMYEEHKKFIQSASNYDGEASPCLKIHLEWAKTLPCKVLYLNGADELEKKLSLIIEEYLGAINNDKHTDKGSRFAF